MLREIDLVELIKPATGWSFDSDQELSWPAGTSGTVVILHPGGHVMVEVSDDSGATLGYIEAPQSAFKVLNAMAR